MFDDERDQEAAVSTETQPEPEPVGPEAAFEVGDRVVHDHGQEYVVMAIAPEAFTVHDDPADPRSPTHVEHGYVLAPASLFTHPQPAAHLSRVGQ
jgi:hypothetical protein